MKTLTDEEIQKLLDDLKPIETSQEVEIYQKVYKELSRSPVLLTPDYDKQIVMSVQKRVDHTANLKIFYAILICITISFSLFAAVSFSLNSSLVIKVLHVLLEMKYVLIFIGFALFAIVFIEKISRNKRQHEIV